MQIQDTTNDPLVAKAIMDRVRSTDDTALAFKVNHSLRCTIIYRALYAHSADIVHSQ